MGMRPRGAKGATMAKHSLKREISVALIAKLAALFLIYAMFFSASHKTVITPSVMSRALFDAPAAENR